MGAPIGIILAGGRSLRLFPEAKPKPLLEVDGRSLLEMAIERLPGMMSVIVCSESIAELIREHFKKKRLKVPEFIIEPEPRDTAAAVGYALRSLRERDPAWVGVISADQWMPEPTHFTEFLKIAEHEIERFPDSLFVGGSQASSKNPKNFSQYGWIIPDEHESGASVTVTHFVEKPDAAQLQDLQSKGALINAGLFFGKFSTFIHAYERLFPEVLNPQISFASLPKQPIDRTIFERFKKVRMIPLRAQWEDLGTWKDWFDHVGEGKGFRKKTEDVFISAENEFEIHAYGVKNLAIVQRGNKILVVPLSESNRMKDFLE